MGQNSSCLPVADHEQEDFIQETEKKVHFEKLKILRFFFLAKLGFAIL